MPRFKIEEEVIIKVRGIVRGQGKINHVHPRIIESRLYGVTLERRDTNGLQNIFALDNKLCCKYGFGRSSYQVYKLEEA